MDLFNKQKVKELEHGLEKAWSFFNSERELSEKIWSVMCVYRHKLHGDCKIFISDNGIYYIGYEDKYLQLGIPYEKVSHLPRAFGESPMTDYEKIKESLNGLL